MLIRVILDGLRQEVQVRDVIFVCVVVLWVAAERGVLRAGTLVVGVEVCVLIVGVKVCVLIVGVLEVGIGACRVMGVEFGCVVVLWVAAERGVLRVGTLVVGVLVAITLGGEITRRELR